MMTKDFSRRKLLRFGARLPIAGAGLAVISCGGETESTRVQVCADPEQLSSGERSLRDSAQYVETSPNPETTCNSCAFFSAENAAQCGDCQIFNGPVNRNGHCTSWSARA
ncbi:high-potential iron-sulfur protein [Hyphococcus sp.]|uniref:high-potential iron-sulfur protein n=1 Tax=Hyphococcus sp. TaxID=2038636 RepID=UPI003CCBCAF2